MVSTAAGAVGSIAGQLAKQRGCRTVGITGGDTKRQLCLDEFGFDAAIDYRQPGLDDTLRQACPQGVDIYYDNTSGRISDAVLQQINRKARIIICGTAAYSSWEPWPEGPRVERHLLNKAARMAGFLAFDYEDRYDEAVTHLAAMIRNGELHYREEILDGLEAAAGSIADLYEGKNLGKRLIRLADD